MVHELAMESQQFVAISPQISHMLARKTPAPHAAHVSVLQFSGTEDELVLYDGGVGVVDHDFLSAENSSATWAQHNGCDSTPEERDSDSGIYTVLEWENCSTGRIVVHIRLNGIGHDLPENIIEGGAMSYMMNFLMEARQ